MSAEFRWEPLWEEEVFRSEGMKLITAATTARIAESVKALAPATSKNNWNKIKRNITADVALDNEGWFGNVVVEKDKRVAHAFLQDLGWTDRKGRWHPGKHYMKKGLAKARVR